MRRYSDNSGKRRDADGRLLDGTGASSRRRLPERGPAEAAASSGLLGSGLPVAAAAGRSEVVEIGGKTYLRSSKRLPRVIREAIEWQDAQPPQKPVAELLRSFLEFVKRESHATGKRK